MNIVEMYFNRKRCFSIVLLVFSPVLLADSLSSIQTRAENIRIKSFDDFISATSQNMFGTINLNELEKLLPGNEKVNINVTDPTTGAILSIKAEPSTHAASIQYYLEGGVYERLGVSYQDAKRLISNFIDSINNASNLIADDQMLGTTEAKLEEGIVAWRWLSGTFECRIALSNAEEYGADLLYECHNQ